MHWGLRSGKGILAALCMVAVLISPACLMAWSQHPLVTYPVMESMPVVADAPAVGVETIDAFLGKEALRIEKWLAEEETWAKKSLVWYPRLPESLIFKASASPETLRDRFCQAIRINPRVKFPLFLQLLPGNPSGERPAMPPADISFLRDISDWEKTLFISLKAGEKVRPLDVVVSAADEPDLLGLDIGLFQDNATDFGKRYGFGLQPFGNPNLEYGSQAPFHMGFYHEADIVYFLAGFLKKTLPEYRIHLYKGLARLAFDSGHPYWGWRFTGLGLHYLADLAQPYHATVLPGVSTARALWINTIDMIGIHGPKADAIQLVSNRHTALEKFAQVYLQRAYRKGESGNPILAALRSAPDGPPYTDGVPRNVVSKLAHDKAELTDKILEKSMPKEFVSDPAFEIGTSPERREIVERAIAEKGQAAVDQLTALLQELLIPFATQGRAYVQAVLKAER
ncbi:MAG: hypothetical protein LLG97_02140 [Deltaproteobacteria bacterium]|nr:hypothetical protein [Deltaproteobacteria bacterium]